MTKNEPFFENVSQGRPWNFFSPLEASKSAFGELLARKSRAGDGQGAPGGLWGRFLETFWLPKQCFVDLFRASVAWCFSLAFGQCVVRLSSCLKDVRAPRANGAHADYIVKMVLSIFLSCAFAPASAEANRTHTGAVRKRMQKQLQKNRLVLDFSALFPFPPAQPPKTSPNDLPDPVRDLPGDPPGG